MAISASPQAQHFCHIDLENLRERVGFPVTLLLMVTGGVGAWLHLPGPDFPWRLFLFFALIGLAGAIAWRLQRASHIASGATLVASAYAVALPAALWLPPPAPTLVFQASVVLASTLVWPWAPLVAAAGASASHWAMHIWLEPQPQLGMALLAYWLTAAFLFFSMNSSFQVLLWSWERHSQAQKLSEQLRDRQGQLNRTIKALDLAYRLLQRTNHELAIAREEADEARHLKEQFAASISHELRTPLNLILGFSEMMYMSPHVYGEVNWTPPLRRDVAQIYSASRHLSQLVDDVLDLSRLNAERMPLRKQLTDLNLVVREAVATVKDLVRDQPISIQLRLDEAIPRMLLDATRLRQVVLNLLNNAIRFTDAGTVMVSTERQNQEVLLSVQDTGVGIPEAELESIFDEFYQSSAASARPSSGMGLGLAISKRFVQMHDGRIWAESTEGQGSTFCVALPLDSQRPAASRLRVSRPLPTPENPYPDSIRLAGDHQDLARLLERHLDGYTVLAAADEDQAKQLAEEHHPRAIVRNLSLATVRRFLAELPSPEAEPAAPVLFTAIPCNAWRAEILHVCGSLQKPVHKEELLRLLQRLGPVENVLVVDDDRGFVQMVSRMLGSADGGYRVSWAYSADEGLEAMRKQRPDVVLLDLLMPGVDGKVFLARMRADENLRDVPVVVVTAMDVEEDLSAPVVGLVGMAQRQGWGVGDSLATLQALLERARPRYLGRAEGRPDRKERHLTAETAES